MGHRTAEVAWIRDMTFDAKAGNHHVILDSAPPHGEDRGPTPKLVFLVGVAGCTAMDVVSILKKGRHNVTDLSVRADGYTLDEHPTRFERIVLTYVVKGTDLDPHAVERAVTLSQERYCSVSATLREGAAIEWAIEIEDAIDPPEGGP